MTSKQRHRLGVSIEALITGLVVFWIAEELLTGDIERAALLAVIVALRIRYAILEVRVQRVEDTLGTAIARYYSNNRETI